MRGSLALGLAALLLGASACGGAGSQEQSDSLTGAGSSLLAPLVSSWAAHYQKRTGVEVGYSSAGSGAGIQAIIIGEVDFGASEAPLSADQKRAAEGVLQIPWGLTATVLAYNTKGVARGLKLSGPVIADIFLGKITRWDDPSIAHLNPGVALPATDITPVFRSDSSGDTYALTEYLSKVSAEWKQKVGTSAQVDFPAGVGSRGNSGVAGTITRQDGSIGYVALSYATVHDLGFASVENAAGNFPVAGIPSIEAAGKTVTSLPPDNSVSITNPPASAANAYPISTFTYALVPERAPKASTLKSFLTYAIDDGQALGKQFQFAPLPEVVVADDRGTIAKIHS
jgi:phosphate transport system substrate-binding protein